MKPLSRRSVIAGSAAAVTALSVLPAMAFSAKPTPGARIKLAVEELRAALEDYYPGARFNITPYSLENGRIAFRSTAAGGALELRYLHGVPETIETVL